MAKPGMQINNMIISASVSFVLPTNQGSRKDAAKHSLDFCKVKPKAKLRQKAKPAVDLFATAARKIRP